VADEKPAEVADVDVDALDETQFEELKTKMRADEPAETAETPEVKAGEPETEEQKAERARYEQGRFTKADDKPADAKPKQETVPHAKFNQANERRKAAEAERDKALDRLRQLLELQQQPPTVQQQGDVPTVVKDPVAAIDWTQQQIIDRNQRDAQAAAERETAQRQEAVYAQAEQMVGPIVRAQAEADPDLAEAYKHMRNSMGRELLRMGYSEADAVAQLTRIEREHVLYMAMNNLDPGEYIKGLAETRGWAPKPPAPPVEEKPVAEKIAVREEARVASLSLGKTGGGVTNTGRVSPEQLLEMSDADFEAY
jgi:hypothetical protein